MKLEQILYMPRQEQAFRINDLEYLSASVLYSGKLRGFEKGSFGNIFINYDLGELTGDASLKGWKLQERFDFSGHDGTNHINYGWQAPDNLIKERRKKGLQNYKDLLKIDLDI